MFTRNDFMHLSLFDLLELIYEYVGMIEDCTGRRYNGICIDLARERWPQDFSSLYFVVRKMTLHDLRFKPEKYEDELFNRLSMK